MTRLILDVPSQFTSDGLQLYAEDISHFGSFLKPTEIEAYIPEKKCFKNLTIEYSLSASEEDDRHTSIAAKIIDSTNTTNTINIQESMYIDEKELAKELNESINSLYDTDIRNLKIIKDSIEQLDMAIANKLLEYGILSGDLFIRIKSLGFFLYNNQIVGTIESFNFSTDIIRKRRIYKGALVELNICLKISNEYDEICFPNVKGWDIHFSDIHLIEEHNYSNDSLYNMIVSANYMYVEKTKKEDFKYNDILYVKPNIDIFIKDRTQYFINKINNKDDDLEFDIDF